MPDTYTPNHNFTKPEIGLSRHTWGTKLNANYDLLDDLLTEDPIGATFLPVAGGNVNGELEVRDRLTVLNATPTLSLYDTTEVSGERNWWVVSSGGNILFQTRSDDHSTVIDTLASIRRSGAADTANTLITRGMGDARYLNSAGDASLVGNFEAGGTITAGGALYANDGDVRIHHGGSNAFITNFGGGALYFTQDTDNVARFEQTGELVLLRNANGMLEWVNGDLYFYRAGSVRAKVDADGGLSSNTSIVNRGSGDGRYAMRDLTLTAGAGLTGLGTLASDRTVSMGTPGDITRTSGNAASGDTHTHRITNNAFKDMFVTFCASGQIGSFAFARNISGTNRDYGQTISGGSLRRAGLDTSGDGYIGASLSGTWECLGNGDSNLTTLWRRVA